MSQIKRSGHFVKMILNRRKESQLKKNLVTNKKAWTVWFRFRAQKGVLQSVIQCSVKERESVRSPTRPFEWRLKVCTLSRFLIRNIFHLFRNIGVFRGVRTVRRTINCLHPLAPFFYKNLKYAKWFSKT